MMWNDRLKNIRDVFAALFDEGDAKRLVADAGLNRNYIEWSRRPVDLWHNIIEYAQASEKVDLLVKNALAIYPNNPNLLQLLDQTYASIRGAKMKNTDWMEMDYEGLQEKITGGSSQLLPVAYLEAGSNISAAVGRLITPFDTVGTCFLIENNLLVTNHHVIPTEEVAENSIVEFNFEKTMGGMDMLASGYKLKPEEYFATDQLNDISVVKVGDNPVEKFSFVPVKDVRVIEGERVAIIQHPGGLTKQVALHENFVAYSDDNLVQYLTDTMPGSSGSPVFNQYWEVVAIHRKGGWLTEPNSKVKMFRNEGTGIKNLLPLIPDYEHE